MNKPPSDIENVPRYEREDYKKAIEKKRTLGHFSMTMEDHLAIGSTPQSDISWVPGKPAHELLSEERIQEFLDAKIFFMNNKKLIQNGFAQISKDEFLIDVPYLESVGKLPAKYKNFDMSSLPDTKRSNDF